jgi:hypothetical protein
MRSFKTHRAFQSYNHPQKDKILKYIELMYAVGSDMNKIDSLPERKSASAQKAGLKVEDMQTIFEERDDAFKQLRHVYLSEYQFHNKYTNLVTWQQMLWNAQRDALKEVEDFDVGRMDKIADFIDKLEGKVSKAFSEIYGNNDIIEIAKENIRVAKSTEERLKETKK